MTDLILPCNVKSEGRNMLVLDNSTIDIPRGEYKAKLYYDDFIFPIMTGKVIEFYCNDDSRYVFRSSHMLNENCDITLPSSSFDVSVKPPRA